jgi:hypothetical protein
MKHVSTLLFAFLLSLPCLAQQTLPEAPAQDVNLRLELASGHLLKSAKLRNEAIFWGVAGTAFTLLAANKGQRHYSEGVAVGFGLATVGGYVMFSLRANAHDRKAALALRHQ